MRSSHFAAPPHKRLLAAGMDLLCVFAIATFLAPLLKLSGATIRFEALVAVVYLAYETIFLKLWMGQSPGRRLLGTVVLRTSGGALSWLHALLRPSSRVIAFVVTADLAFRYTWPEYTGDIRIPLFPLVEVGLLLTNPSRRTLADYLALTVVANAPPLQPHRAPAGPMYSERDAEFGFPPSRPRADGDPKLSSSNSSSSGREEA
jgi:uncharacterized RDD family membrane protein YckC